MKKSKEDRAVEIFRMIVEAVRVEFERQRQFKKRKRAHSEHSSSSDLDSEYGTNFHFPAMFSGGYALSRWLSSSAPAGRYQFVLRWLLVPLVRAPRASLEFPPGPFHCPRFAVA